jgi:hypothetical protein
MRKVFILSLVILAMATFSQAALIMSLDFVYENTGVASVSGGCYNYVTDHYYVCEAYLTNGSILNNDGTDSGSDLDVTGMTFGSLGFWTLTVTSDGVIYGGSNYEPAGRLYRWANEAATPTEQDITGLAFSRCLACRGTGADTIIASTGTTDDSIVDILTTSDGVSFILSETTPGLTDVKQGIDIADGGQTIYGGEGYGGLVPMKYDKIGGVWTQDTAFAPDTAHAFSPCPMAYWDGRDVLFCLNTRDSVGINLDPDDLLALDGSSGQLLAKEALGYNVGLYGYGDIQLNTSGTSGEGRFICRNGASTGYLAGKFTFSHPTPAPITAADSVWGLYE